MRKNACAPPRLPRDHVDWKVSEVPVLTRRSALTAVAALVSTCSLLPDRALSADTPSDAPDVGALLEKVGDAYGGLTALTECPGFRARGKVHSVSDGVNGTLKLSLSLDGALRVEIDYPNRSETRILSGKLAWNGGRRRQRPSDRSMASSVRLQYHRLAAPFEIVATEVADLEPDGVSDEGWLRFRRQWAGGLHMIYEIDADTGRIKRTRGVIEDGPLEFVTESFDFRDIDGVWFPFRMTTWVAGRVAAETILDRVTIEGDFPSKTFLPAGTGSDI